MTPEVDGKTERLSAGAVRFLLALGYLCLAALYAWQASKRVSPTIFSDEIEFTQISRAIAEDGVPSRRGVPSGFQTLYTYLVAPAWLFDDSERAWEAAKLIGVLVMTSAIFPAYGLARFVVSRPWALAAAIGAVAAPPLAFAPYLLDEPLGYPVSTAALWAIATAVARPSALRFGIAFAISVLATFVSGQLAVLLVVLAAGGFVVAWRTDRFTRWRTTWTRADWAGAAVLVVGAVVVASAAAGHQSEPWYRATGFFKQRILDHGVWSVAAMAIGLGVLPIIATVVALLSRSVRATDEGRAFVVVGATAFAAFAGYAAIKGAYLSTTFAVLVVERNVIYLVPIALAATAAVLARPIATLPALAAGLAASLYLILNADFRLDQYPYFEAPGLAITTLANRNFAWDEIKVERALVLAALVSFAILVARWRVRPPVGLGIAVVAATAVATWGLTAEVYAARGLNTFAERLHGSTPQPVDWIDRATGGEPTLYLGQNINDANQIWLMEFWNRSIDHVWSLDGTAPVPTLSPDLGAPDGTIKPSPDVKWVVTGNGVEVVGERVGEPRGNTTLFRAEPPVRLRYAQNGVSTDGWMGAHASFSQYAPEDGVSRGFARISLSRQGACSESVPTSDVVVRVGTVVVRRNQPALGRVQQVIRRKLAPCALEVVVARATVPYHVDVTVSPTFVPAEIDASSGDVRELGAQVGFSFIPVP